MHDHVHSCQLVGDVRPAPQAPLCLGQRGGGAYMSWGGASKAGPVLAIESWALHRDLPSHCVVVDDDLIELVLVAKGVEPSLLNITPWTFVEEAIIRAQLVMRAPWCRPCLVVLELLVVLRSTDGVDVDVGARGHRHLH